MKLIINKITKTYQNKIVLNQFDHEFHKGIYALLGNNGAGKTTLMKCICQLIQYDCGDIKFEINNKTFAGKDMLNYIGYMPQIQELYGNFTIRQFLDYMATLKKLSNSEITKREIEKYLQYFLLFDIQHKNIKTLSGGMKQRVLLAQALLGNPPILLLDEPTVGLDFEQNYRFRNLLSNLSKDHIVIIASHSLQDMERIANYCIFLKEGNVLAINHTQDFLKLLSGKVYELQCEQNDLSTITANKIISSIYYEEEIVKVRFVGAENNKKAKEVVPVLEDVYLYFMSDGHEKNKI